MPKGKILVTGGAGYIGSHTVKNLLKKGYRVLVIDNLSRGFIEPIKILQRKFKNLEFIRADLNNAQQLDGIFTDKEIDSVMHFAALVSVEESMKCPERYHQENYLNSINLVDAMSKHGVQKIIFSSSCVVYGTPKYTPIDENHPTNPQSPYGQTKLDFEKYLSKVNNLKHIIFRYFNVGGSDIDGNLGKSSITNEDLISNIIKVGLGQNNIFTIYGNDYDTSDGTTIRDFLHVEDISRAHILALEHLDNYSGEIFNLGSGSGFTVQGVVNKASEIIGEKINIKFAARRPGDIPISVAIAQKAKDSLKWEPQYSDLDIILKTDWQWRKKHPHGY
ncbi:MAG: galE [Candidatus Berkelbacteria bacterium]|nr:galE [Candidatus Berkelbacteria bacterium]